MNTVNTLDQISREPSSLNRKAVVTPPGFDERLTAAVNSINTHQHTADQSMEQVVEGKLGIHEGMMNIARADTSLRLLTQVRNKAMEAYKEIMNMQF